MHGRRLATLAVVIASAAPLCAQSAHGTSVDVSIGASTGTGGRYVDRGGGAAEFTLALPHESARVVAFTAGWRGALATADVCIPEAGPGTRCLPSYPSIAHVGLLGGLQGTLPGGAVRGMVGPALYTGRSGSTIGGQLQLDAATGFTHVAFVCSGQASLLARRNGESLRLGALTFGVRLQ